jgi:hypothetical protein
MIEFTRIFSMPNKHTFEMKPAYDFITPHIAGKKRTCDPFCGRSTLADSRNDLAISGVPSEEWLQSFPDESMQVVLFDPPYSPRQLKECYDSIGETLHDTKSSVWRIWKEEIARIIEPNGYALSFGNNSGGIGMVNGFDIERVRLIPHGGNHYDTICVAERKL